MQECLLKLLCDKTVVYATHQMEFLEASDVILVSYTDNFSVIVEINFITPSMCFISFTAPI